MLKFKTYVYNDACVKIQKKMPKTNEGQLRIEDFDLVREKKIICLLSKMTNKDVFEISRFLKILFTLLSFPLDTSHSFSTFN